MRSSGILLPQRLADNLAGGSQGEGVDEGDLAGVLVGGEACLHKVLDLAHQGLVAAAALLQHEEGLDPLGADGVGHTDRGGHRHGWIDRKSTRLNSSHYCASRMHSSV